MAYWPLIQIIVWGFITKFMGQHSTWLAQAAGALIGAVLLWDVLFRANLGVAIAFMEEIWSRNLGYLFASPLRPGELVASLLLLSLLRTIISTMPAFILAAVFYSYSLFDLGFWLLAFFFLLLFCGYALGLLVAGLVLRYGQGAESLAWVGVFAISPLSGIYYPLDVLPTWVQPLALILPPSYVFEGMRALVIENVVRLDLLGKALLWDGIYLSLGIWFFLRTISYAKDKGLILGGGE